MKLTPTVRTDPRAASLPLAVDDAAMAAAIRNAPTQDEAWRWLGFPGGRADVDPAVLERLLASTTGCIAASDAIAKGLIHFGQLAPDADPPAAWVDRMAELYVAELEAFWALDDLAWEGLESGGWTATTPGFEVERWRDPAARIVNRTRWQVEHLRPKKPVLWFDRLDHALGRTTDADAAREAGRTLVAEAARRRFAAWTTTRTEATP